MFLVGVALCGNRVIRLSRGLNELKRNASVPGAPAPPIIAAAAGRAEPRPDRRIAEDEVRRRITPIRHLANSLVLIGLIGTVIGFIIALSGVRPEAAIDVGAIAPMVSTLIIGMAVALYTTLVGSVLNVWLMVNSACSKAAP